MLTGSPASRSFATVRRPMKPVAPSTTTSSAPGQETVPEVEVDRLGLARHGIVEEIRLERTVAADRLQRAAREALPEGQIELHRAALAAAGDREAVDEDLARSELARAQDV